MAAVLISFGVVLGTTSPVQLVIMAGIEIVLFNINEVIGRSYIGAVDAGDTIFVHLFGAYFGLAMSRVLYDRSATTSSKAGANRISDLFSMVTTCTFSKALQGSLDRDGVPLDVLAELQQRGGGKRRRPDESGDQHM